MLGPYDVIEGSSVPNCPGVYVVGCFDNRITLYSQQVRALELAYALHDQGHLSAHKKIAVIGGGAAGVTVAAAIALTDNVTVHLFERSDKLLPLQSASSRRRIDPHLYDWPKYDTDHEIAEFPILDWQSDTAANVRQTIIRGFTDVTDKVPARITLALKHDVKAIHPTGSEYEVEFSRERTLGDGPGADDLITARMRVDLVILAFGYGLEPERPIENVTMESYWSDAGIPGPEIAGRPRPRFFVSGNGDGGLIDFVAASSADFDHASTIRAIIRQPGIHELYDRLNAIDIEARSNQGRGLGFDFVANYDKLIFETAKDLGLIELVRGRLRPGVQLVFQTIDTQLMSVKTAIINRFAAYLTIKACEIDEAASFKHVHCVNLLPGTQPKSKMPAAFWFDCDGEILGADKAIIRRGPSVVTVRERFLPLLGTYADLHESWLQRHAEDTIIPTLSDAARTHFNRSSKEARLPLPGFRHAAWAGQIPTQIKIQRAGANIRWTGDIGPSNASRFWDPTLGFIKVYCHASPTELGPAAFSVARLVIHSEHINFYANVAAWRPFFESLTVYSQQTENFTPPRLFALGTEGVIHNPISLTPDALHNQINSDLDSWTLSAVDEQLQGYLRDGRDRANRIGFKSKIELRTKMLELWTEWRHLFATNPEILARYLRLSVCALDSEQSLNMASTIVGRLKLLAIVRSTAFSLTVATAWAKISPRDGRPGNLHRLQEAQPEFTGHVCAADRIDGEAMTAIADKFSWGTNFVILPMMTRPSGSTYQANLSISKIELGQPTLTEIPEQPSMVLTLDEAFIRATEEGPEAVSIRLGKLESDHFEYWNRSIERAPT